MYNSKFNSRFPALVFNRSALLAFALLALAAPSLHAADTVRYKAYPLGSKVVIDGKANVHPHWSMQGSIIGGYLEIPAGAVLDPAKASPDGVKGKLAATADISIPVTSIRNNDTGFSGMNNAMLDAMHAEEFPRIEFRLKEMVFKEPHAAGTPLQFDTKGELLVHGVTNLISMPVSIEASDKSRLKVSGSVPLKMTSFKIDPPNVAHAFVSADDVVISFEWIISPPAAPKP